MATDVTSAPARNDNYSAPRTSEPSLSGLVGGIIDDVQKLITDQIALLKHDIRKDVDRAKESGMLLGVGIGMLTAGAIVLLFMFVHLLEWLTRPNLEWWVCYAIVGGAVASIGGAVFYCGKQKLEKVNVVPEQTTEGLKENLQWKTNPN